MHFPSRTLGAACILCTCLVSGVHAQTWATKDACDIRALPVVPPVVAGIPVEVLDQKADSIANATGRFWKVTGTDAETSYLWGTYHSSNRFILDLPPAVVAALERSKIATFEIDPIFASRDAFWEAVNRPNLFRPVPSTFSFSDLDLPDQVETWVYDRLDGLGWGGDSMHHLTLGSLTELLLTSPCDDFNAGIIPDQDSYLQTRAHIAGIPVLGLEHAQRLKTHFDKPENTMQARAMIAVFASYLAPQDSPASTAAHMALYLQGRIGASMIADQAEVTSALGQEADALYRDMNRYLLEQRNHDFLGAAQGELARGGVFMAVGAYHLPGASGLVDLLRAQGYTVDRIPLPGEAL